MNLISNEQKEGEKKYPFARWMSLQEGWVYYRQEMWPLRDILLENSGALGDESAGKNTTSMLDAELARRMTTSKDGLLARCPGYITQEVIDGMGPCRCQVWWHFPL